MKIFTESYELSTAITNIFISLSAMLSFYFININKYKKTYTKKLWILFFCLIFIAGILGFIIHGIRMGEETINFLWIILSFVFCLSVHSLLSIFLQKVNTKRKFNIPIIFIASIAIYAILFIQLINGLDFLKFFIIYASLCLVTCLAISIYLYFVKHIKYNKYYIIGILFQFIGGVLLLIKNIYIDFIIKIDHNGIYHLCMIMTIIFFYIGSKKELNQ